MQSNPYGLFLGTCNPFYGCQVYLADERFTLPQDLRVEPKGDVIELRWVVPEGTVLSNIYRLQLFGEGIRLDNLKKIAETSEQYYVDEDVEPGKTYIYMVKCENEAGELSEQSNIAYCYLSKVSRSFRPGLRENLSDRYRQLIDRFKNFREN